LNLDLQDAESWQNKGTALIHRQQYSEALASSEKALQIDPELAVAQQNKIAALKEIQNEKRK
jgi:tetratricopeptide (TPR) repeat protein